MQCNRRHYSLQSESDVARPDLLALYENIGSRLQPCSAYWQSLLEFRFISSTGRDRKFERRANLRRRLQQTVPLMMAVELADSVPFKTRTGHDGLA
jgi:hypothetical protein